MYTSPFDLSTQRARRLLRYQRLYDRKRRGATRGERRHEADSKCPEPR